MEEFNSFAHMLEDQVEKMTLWELRRMPVVDRKMKVLLRHKEQHGKRHSLRLEKSRKQQ